MTSNCSHCVHWALSATTPRSFARTGTAACSLGPAYVYLHASKTCPRFTPAAAEVVQKRRVVVKAARTGDDSTR
jgi:hypothetical protein